MKNKITRKDKKSLRAIALCLTGNPAERKSKYSKNHWFKLKQTYIVWFRLFRMEDRKEANSLRYGNNKKDCFKHTQSVK